MLLPLQALTYLAYLIAVRAVCSFGSPIFDDLFSNHCSPAEG